jgi:uncharacterized protein (TIGR02452 family)
MSLRGIAEETLRILDLGFYESAGQRVEIGDAQRTAIAGTRLLRPADLERLLALGPPERVFDRTTIAVTREKTQQAARRLVHQEGVDDVVVLNFASARNVGGGFLGGARAQEEDVVRSSGLYRCLETQPEYYAENRACSSLLYTDHIIYSPRVPFFRENDRDLLPTPFLASVITAPAPNAGAHLRAAPDGRQELEVTLRRRVAYVLATAEMSGHSTLVLGAWGGGVFRNDPVQIADSFVEHLESPRFRASFARVEFAIYDSSASLATVRAFEARARALAELRAD